MYYRTYLTIENDILKIDREIPCDNDYLDLEFPVGSLLFGMMEVNWDSLYEYAYQVLCKCKAIPKTEKRIFSKALNDPENCEYLLVAKFYQISSNYIKQVSPALFCFYEDYCLALYRRYHDARHPYQQPAEDCYAYCLNRTYNEDCARKKKYADMNYEKYSALMQNADIVHSFCRLYPDVPKMFKPFDGNTYLTLADYGVVSAAQEQLQFFLNLINIFKNAKKDFQELIQKALYDYESNTFYSDPCQRLINLQANDSLYKKRLEDIDSLHIRVNHRISNKIGKVPVKYVSYASDHIPALVLLDFQQLCFLNKHILRCQNCGRLFIAYSRKSKYCSSKIHPDDALTCKDIAKVKYQDKLKNDSAKSLLNQRRNAYYMRVSRMDGNAVALLQYQTWQEESKKALEEYNSGQISFEEFDQRIALP